MAFVNNNGTRIHYEIQGEGDPVLLIMGITAPASVWEAHVADWSQHFRCILPDNRGVGQSDAPPGDYSSDQMADDMAAVLDELQCGPVAVVGVSMGSIIAQSLALRYPDKVSRLVLMCPWARCDRRALATFEHLKLLKETAPPDEFMRYVQLLIFSKDWWDDDQAHADMLAARNAALEDPVPQTLQGLSGQAAACMNHDKLDELHQIRVPTLIIGGEEDQFTPRWMAEEIHERLPQSSLHLYPRSGHAFHWENLADFNPRVREFLRERALANSLAS